MNTLFFINSLKVILLSGVFILLILGCSGEEGKKVQRATSIKTISVFKTPEDEAHYMAAYNSILTRWPVAYQELNIPTSFGTTHIIASGSPNAKPLFLLHAMDASAMEWILNVSELSRQYRVYAVDVIGEPNKSRPVHGLITREECSQWLIEVFNYLKIEKAYIAGNSGGGFLTLNQAFYTPDRIEKVIMISPAATFASIWPFYLHAGFSALSGIFQGQDKVTEKVWEWILQGIPVDKGWKDLMTMAINHGKYLNLTASVFKKKELQSIRVPVLLLIGGKEVIYNPEKTIKKAKELIPDIQAEIIPNANHVGPVSNPGYVNKRILDYLQEH